jgi:hypothetical protein
VEKVNKCPLCCPRPRPRPRSVGTQANDVPLIKNLFYGGCCRGFRRRNAANRGKQRKVEASHHGPKTRGGYRGMISSLHCCPSKHEGLSLAVIQVHTSTLLPFNQSYQYGLTASHLREQLDPLAFKALCPLLPMSLPVSLVLVDHTELSVEMHKGLPASFNASQVDPFAIMFVSFWAVGLL